MLVFVTAGVLLAIVQGMAGVGGVFVLKMLVPEVTSFHWCISIHLKTKPKP